MFHIVYTRHLHDREDYGSFDNTWTVLRNVPYSRISEFTKDKLIEMSNRVRQRYFDANMDMANYTVKLNKIFEDVLNFYN